MNARYEKIGWLGFILIVSAYLMVTIRIVAVNSANYHLLNFFGAICLVANAKHSKAWPLFWLNIVWCIVALIGLLQL